MFPRLKSRLTTSATKRAARSLGLLVLALALAGCAATEKVTSYFKGDEDNVEPPAELVEFTPRISVIELWKKSHGVGTDEQYLKLAPVVVNQRLYIIDAEGGLDTLDATNGKRLWRKTIEASQTADDKGWFKGSDVRITGGPGYGENTIMVGTEEGEVISLSADDGDELWRARVTSEILSAPQRAANVAIVRTIDGKVFGIDGRKGKRLWVYDRTVPPLTLRGTGAPIIDQGLVVTGFDGGKLAALELRTGKLRWETSIATARGRSELERMVDIDSEPVVVGSTVYVASFQGQLAAVDLDSGRTLWSRNLSSHAGFGADEDNIYATNDDSHILALDRFSGATLWRQEALRARGVTAPGAIGDQIVVGDMEGYLHWIDKDTGYFSARSRLCDKPIIAKPIVVGKVAYAYCSDGRLASYTHR